MVARADSQASQLPEIEKARANNPHDVVITKYECMAYAHLIARTSDRATRQRYRARLAGILDARRYQYSPQHPWFAEAGRLAAGASD